jgi:hypothetical protein
LKSKILNVADLFSDSIFRPLVLGIISGTTYSADFNEAAIVSGVMVASALTMNVLKEIFPERYKEALKKGFENMKDK